MEELLFDFVRRDPGARFSVTRVKENSLVDGHEETKWRVEVWCGKYSMSSHVTATSLHAAIKSALKSVNFEPIEDDCRCGLDEYPCPFHNWIDSEEA